MYLNAVILRMLQDTKIKVISEDELLNRILGYQRKNKKACRQFQKNIMERYCVNYIRHRLVSDYDENVWEIRWNFDKSDYLMYKIIILMKIKVCYPQYATECMAQINQIKNRYEEKYGTFPKIVTNDNPCNTVKLYSTHVFPRKCHKKTPNPYKKKPVYTPEEVQYLKSLGLRCGLPLKKWE